MLTSRYFYKTLLIFSICFLFFSCATVQIHQETHRLTTKKVILAGIGVGNELLLENTYKNTAIIDFKKPLRVVAIPVTFTKKTHKAYKKAKESQPIDFTISYIDSLPKPKFINFQIMDRVALIHALNIKKNRNIRNYLSIQPDTRIVTSISMAMGKKNLISVLEADAIFLGNKEKKSYELQLYKDNELIGRIDFDQGVVFTYNTATFCWQENSRQELQIVDLVSEQNSCPKETYSKAKRADKTINYFNF